MAVLRALSAENCMLHIIDRKSVYYMQKSVVFPTAIHIIKRFFRYYMYTAVLKDRKNTYNKPVISVLYVFLEKQQMSVFSHIIISINQLWGSE